MRAATISIVQRNVPAVHNAQSDAESEELSAKNAVLDVFEAIRGRNERIVDEYEEKERKQKDASSCTDVDGREMQTTQLRITRWLITDTLLHQLNDAVFLNTFVTRVECPIEYV